MKLTGSYEIKLNKQLVWEALNNPEILKKVIPGCEEFTKNSDTEVLLNILIHYGTEGISLLNGSFAFAFFDKKSFLIEKSFLFVILPGLY